ncbi:DNA translocase FtsK [Brevibacillus sp. GCM10020057]|uniref:DNA translocase FtsK n=1 Tax=Brevibacillus sp. GCM10020057 TaxID=3317327 RepID=UPI003626456D
MWLWLQKLMSFFRGEEEQSYEEDVRPKVQPAPRQLQAKTKSIYPKERAYSRTGDESRQERERRFRFPVVPDDYLEKRRKDKPAEGMEQKQPARERQQGADRDAGVAKRDLTSLSAVSRGAETRRNSEIAKASFGKASDHPARPAEMRPERRAAHQPDEPRKAYKPSEIVSPVYGKITPATREEEHRIHTTAGIVYPRLEQEEHLNQLKQWEQLEKAVEQSTQPEQSAEVLAPDDAVLSADAKLPDEAALPDEASREVEGTIGAAGEELAADGFDPSRSATEEWTTVLPQEPNQELSDELRADPKETALAELSTSEKAAVWAAYLETQRAETDSQKSAGTAVVKAAVANEAADDAPWSGQQELTETALGATDFAGELRDVNRLIARAGADLLDDSPEPAAAFSSDLDQADVGDRAEADTPESETAETEQPVASATEQETAAAEQPVAPATEQEIAATEQLVTPASEQETAETEQPVASTSEPATAATAQPVAALTEPAFPPALEQAVVSTAAASTLEQTAAAAPSHTAVAVEPAAQAQVEQVPAYVLPPLDLLNPGEVPSDDDDEHTQLQKLLLEETLSNFNVSAQVVGIVKGPSVTRFELQPAPGVKVNKITSLIDDIKLNLAAKDIRIEAPIPGRNAIGIEVPNLTSRPVMISTIIGSDKFQKHSSPLAVALGMDIGGEPIVADIKKMPHGLIAGATGSGKSVCINSIIVSLLYKATPEQVRLLLIDPKMVELAPYNHLPHLVTPVVTEAKQATAALKWAVEEMEKRYALFVDAGVRDIDRYNQTTDDTLPYIVIVIDELADLMMVSPQDVEDCIIRIAQKARACGIHLLLATQRPSVDVITGNIKANVPTRLAFAVFSQVDSRTILDQSGAERLLGRGDMLFLESGTAPVRLQGNFVSDDEIERITQVIKRQRKPSYMFSKEDLEQQVQSYDAGDDPLYLEALVFVAEQGQASASALQRRFRVGYNRAARLIEMMEADGYVAGQNGGKARAVLITREDALAVAEGSTLL